MLVGRSRQLTGSVTSRFAAHETEAIATSAIAQLH
jgi:hypothetical protein